MVDEGVFHGISVDNAIFVIGVGEHSTDPFLVNRVMFKGDHFSRESTSQVDITHALDDVHFLFTGSARSDLMSI